MAYIKTPQWEVKSQMHLFVTEQWHQLLHQMNVFHWRVILLAVSEGLICHGITKVVWASEMFAQNLMLYHRVRFETNWLWLKGINDRRDARFPILVLQQAANQYQGSRLINGPSLFKYWLAKVKTRLCLVKSHTESIIKYCANSQMMTNLLKLNSYQDKQN